MQLLENKIHNCDALTGLRKLPDESVNCCITSPPYYGLRSYDIPDIIYGAADQCDHKWSKTYKPPTGGKNPNPANVRANKIQNKMSVRGTGTHSKFCQRCGAWMGQLGLEPNLDLYIEHLLEIFFELKRVLRKDGTLWIVLGDSYAGSGRGFGSPLDKKYTKSRSRQIKPEKSQLKRKNLIGIPWTIAFALRNRQGWILRSEIIWNKPNCGPETVKDRLTRSHDTIFLLTKNETYWYDNKAIEEPLKESSKKRAKYSHNPKAPYDEFVKFGSERNKAFFRKGPVEPRSGRNKRTVWTVSVSSDKITNYASFPIKLIEPCVLAGCPKSGIVIDPFIGSGTSALVAYKHGRRYIGFEISKEYCKLAEKRLSQTDLIGEGY